MAGLARLIIRPAALSTTDHTGDVVNDVGDLRGGQIFWLSRVWVCGHRVVWVVVVAHVHGGCNRSFGGFGVIEVCGIRALDTGVCKGVAGATAAL